MHAPMDRLRKKRSQKTPLNLTVKAGFEADFC